MPVQEAMTDLALSVPALALWITGWRLLWRAWR
ncbi:hypothetical protein LCGC14_1590590 [marine sediment metagenome]|uniref:Uncharacterized protein n=1 Tax=marine sediment metagenome TaxID=412755 RepID=A0A0F9IE12_9ZZZZ